MIPKNPSGFLFIVAVTLHRFEDSNTEYRINPYSAYFTFDVFHVTATIRNPRLFRNGFTSFSSLLKREIIVLSTMT